MKKLLIIAAILAIGAGAYLYMHPKLRSGLERRSTHFMRHHNTTTLYKWRDATGHWQLSGEPPPIGTSYQIEHYRDNTNVVPAQAITGQPKKR